MIANYPGIGPCVLLNMNIVMHMFMLSGVHEPTQSSFQGGENESTGNKVWCLDRLLLLKLKSRLHIKKNKDIIGPPPKADD